MEKKVNFVQKIRYPNGQRKIFLCGRKIFSYKLKKKQNCNKFLIDYEAEEGGISTESPNVAYKPFISLNLVPDFIANKDIYYHVDKPNLLSGLDRESYRVIMTVLNKYEYLAAGGMKDLLETSEQIRYNNTVVKSFFNSIKKQKDGTYKYKDFILPENHFETSVFLDEHGLDKINAKLGNGTIIDVGSYIGDSILIFKKHFPDNQIIGFEATSGNYQKALQTLKLNNLTNVLVENLALGDKTGSLTLSTDQGSGNSWEFSCLSEKVEHCKMETLDNYLKTRHCPKVELIKVDIEGAEQLFIHGALETIKRDRPIILMSIYHNYDDLMHIKPFFENLNLGYKFKIHKPIDTIFNEILLICIPA